MDVNAEGKRIRETFEGNADKALEKLRKKLEKGTATYADVLKYASETGQEAGRVLAEELPALYPDGIIPEADAARLLPPTLRSNNAMVLEAAGQVQKAKNLKEGVQLNAVLPEYNDDYEQMLIRRVAEVVKTDKFWTHTFPQSVENMAMCAVDDTVRANADFQVRSGIHRKIRRQTVGKCCQWCSDLAGTYDYENVNNAGNDVWRRHKNCDCLIEDVRDGRRKMVYNYREKNTERGRMETARRKAIQLEYDLQFFANPKQREFAIEIDNNPSILGRYTPASLKEHLESIGYQVEPLGGGRYKGVRFDSGGGWRIHYSGDGLLMYHPEEGSHHGQAYYKISNGKKGVRRYDTGGNQIEC